MPGSAREIENANNSFGHSDEDGVPEIQVFFPIEDELELLRYKLTKGDSQHTQFRESIKTTAKGTIVILKFRNLKECFEDNLERYNELLALRGLAETQDD